MMKKEAHSPNYDHHAKEMQQEGGQNKKSKFKKRKITLALAGLLAVTYNIYKQGEVNNEHESLDFVFKPEDMTTQEMLKYIVITPEYSNNTKKWLSRHGIPLEGNTDSYSIFVNLKDHKTIQDKKKAINELREKQSRPILISTDFEGGYVHAIDELTDEEIEKYGVPKRILELRDQEDNGKNKVSAFPSAEFLGKLYEKIVFNGTHKERLDFLIMMQKYGESIRKIMEDIGVDIVFGPCVDIVPDFDGDTPIAKNDRSFGENFILAQDLISSFVNGFQDPGSHVLLVPKHYVGLGASKSDPHMELSESDRNKNSGTETIFNNLINGVNDQLNQKKNNDFIISFNNSKNKDPKYGKTLEKNKQFINYLSKKKSLSDGEEIKALMTTHTYGLWGISETITYSAQIIDRMKNRIGKTNTMRDGIVFSDDLDMEGAKIGLPKGVENNDINKIGLALASGHDVVMDLGGISNDVFEELADSIDNGFDINNDGKIDLTRDMLYEKIKKVLEISVKKGELEKANGKYRLKDATYFHPSIGKAIRDAFYSNQGPISGSGIKEYKSEGDGKSDMLIKKGKSLYEYFIHNGPNAVWKVLKVLYKELIKDEEYKKTLEEGKKLIIVDKSEYKMFIFTIDGKKLLETHQKVGIGKGSSRLDYKHDRRILGDDKTPVGYYMVVDRAMGGDELRERGLNSVGWYGGEDGGLIALAGPWTPYVAIHGTEGDIGPSSNACVRVLDPSEDGEGVDKSKQIAINHINKILPDGSFVIITN